MERGDSLRAVDTTQRRRPVLGRGHIRERVRLSAPVGKVGGRNRTAAAMREHDQSAWTGVGERTKEHGVHNAHDRRRGADTEGECENGRDREAGISTQGAPAVFHVAGDKLDGGLESRDPHVEVWTIESTKGFATELSAPAALRAGPARYSLRSACTRSAVVARRAGA